MVLVEVRGPDLVVFPGNAVVKLPDPAEENPTNYSRACAATYSPYQAMAASARTAATGE